MELTDKELRVRKELTKLYPQLLINAQKTCGAAFDKHGLDLIAVAVEFFLKKPIDVQIEAIENNKMENFITFIMASQLKSGTSHFFTHYRKFHEKQREFYPEFDYGSKYTAYNTPFKEEDNLPLECLKHHISELDPYNKMLAEEHFMKGENITKISKKYNINYGHIKRDKDLLVKKLKRKCQHLL